MKHRESTVTLQRGGTQKESTFTIAAKGKAFGILSSSLYTDPMLAVVRELSCNARDSHIANGNPNEPFLVHLPNSIEPFFEVRDYGTGLSDHDVFHVFSTYFESTKDQSDDFIGCLGLGSKSPFSYNDVFEVVSWFDGVQTTYSMFKNEDGIPSVVKMNEVPSNERTGLSVKLVIKPTHFTTFSSNLSKALMFFDVKPTVVGVADFEFKALPDKLYTPANKSNMSPAWSLYRSYSRELIAVQGGVGYRVDIKQIDEMLSYQQHQLISYASLILYFDMGMIDVPPSREEVRYDEVTIQNIVNAIVNCQKELLDDIAARVRSLSTPWAVYTALNEIGTTYFGQQRFVSNYMDASHTSMQTVIDYIKNRGSILYDIDERHSATEEDRQCCLKYFTVRVYNNIVHHKGNLGRFVAHTMHTIDVVPSSSTRVIVLDQRSAAIKKLRQFVCDDSTITTAVVLVPNDYKLFDSDESQAEYDLLYDGFGQPPIDRISDVTVTKANTLASTKKPYNWYKLTSTSSRSYGPVRHTFDAMRADDPNAPSGGLYYTVTNHATIRIGSSPNSSDVKWSKMDRELTNLITIINKVKGTTYTINDVWGARAGLVTQQLVKDDSWTNIFALAGECVSAFVDDHVLDQRMSATTHLFNSDDTIEVTRRINALSDCSLFKQTIMPYIEILEDTTTLIHSQRDVLLTARVLDSALASAGSTVSHNRMLKPEFNISPIYETDTLLDRYPMLTYVSRFDYSGDSCIGHTFDYVQLIDEKHS